MNQLTTKALAFADDAQREARRDYIEGRIPYTELVEVLQAAAYLRGIARYGTPAVESP